MRLHVLLGLASILLRPALGIFSDDAFHIDYHIALLGVPQSHNTFFHQPQASSNASLLYTLSEKGLVAAVNPKDGMVLWRQAVAGEIVDNTSNAFLVAGNRNGQLYSGHGDRVTCWDALSGRIVWQYILAPGTVVRGLQTVSEVGHDSTNAAQDVVVLAAPVEATGAVTVSRVAEDGTGIKWQHSDSSIAAGDTLSITTSADKVYYITNAHGLLSSNKAKITILNIGTGRESGQQSVSVDAEPLGEGQQYSTGACMGTPFLVSSEAPYKSVKVNLLGKSKVATLDIENKGEEVEKVTVHHPCGQSSPPHFLVHVRSKSKNWAQIFHIDPKTGDVNKAYSLPATEESSTFAASSVGTTAYFTRVTESEVSLFTSESHGRLARWTRKGGISYGDGNNGRTAHAVAEVVSRGKSAVAVRVAEASANGDWSLIRNGEMQWTRPESLAYATIAAWADDAEIDALAGDLEVESSANPVIAYIHRLKRHLNDLTRLPEYLISLPDAILKTQGDSAISTTRKKLVGTKNMIIGTCRMEILAIDATNNGAIKWHADLSSRLGQGVAFKSIFVNGGRATLYISDGSLLVVNTTTGAVSEHKQGSMPVSNLMELPGNPAPAIVRVDSDGKPQLATDFAPSVASEGNAIVTLSETGNAIGWTVGQSIERTWTLRPEAGFKFLNATSRSAHDPVASIGKVLGDRSVLYKYISPNLVLLTAFSSTAITIYLIDAVTGSVLHTSAHQGIVPGSAVPTAMSENWFAYSFTSQDPKSSALSTQLVISELYESATPNDRGSLSAHTNYSSFSADAATKPYVISQSYTIAEPISDLAITQTAQGITTRQLLATLPNSDAIIGIPREILNARRPVDRDPTSIELEEGLFRYSPTLELDPKMFLTHSREVIGIKKILTDPSLLESTSMVLAFGHDLFGIQLAPSMAFDVLGKQFNKGQMLLTVLALGAGVVAIRPMVRTQTVERRWKM